jgi:hypothetical protein
MKSFEPISPRHQAIQGFLERIVELFFIEEVPDADSAAHLMRKVEEFNDLTDQEFEERYLS